MFEYVVVFLLVYIALQLTYIAVKENKEENKKDEEEEEEEDVPLKSFKEMEDELKIMNVQLDILSKNVDFFVKKEMSKLWKWEE